MGKSIDKTKEIDKRRSLQITFYKRRNGLIKKAMELSMLCKKEILLIILNDSNDANSFCYCSNNNYPHFIDILQNQNLNFKNFNNNDYITKYQEKKQKGSKKEKSSKKKSEKKEEANNREVNKNTSLEKSTILNASTMSNFNLDNIIPHPINEDLDKKLRFKIPCSNISLGETCKINPIDADNNNNNFGNDANLLIEPLNVFTCDNIDNTELIKDVNMNSFN